MDKVKRFIDCMYTATKCNLRCSYCYITQEKKWEDKLPKLKYSPEVIGEGLSQARLGGICHINICGVGETLIPPEMTDIIYNILKQGHYVMVITNGTISKRFDEIIKFPKEYLDRLSFKFSFHYEELIRLQLMDEFFHNVHKVSDAGASFSLEITPHDGLIDRIPEIKEICLKNVGAFCHVTVARDASKFKIPILTNLTREEYMNTWGNFDSEMFRFKMSTFGVKRKEFCYAGDWTCFLNLVSGIMTPCYYMYGGQNIFDDITKPIHFEAMGECHLSHCYNSHAFLTIGAIPELETPQYLEMRDRIDQQGNHWVKPQMREFFSTKLVDSNEEYDDKRKRRIRLKSKIKNFPIKLYLFITRQ